MKKIKITRKMKIMFLLGAVIGAIAGILFTMLIANGIITDHKEVFSSDIAALTEENEEYKLPISKNEAAHNNTEVLAGDTDGWSLVLVNEEHPLDTSYVPEEMVEVEPERSVDIRIMDDLQAMLDDAKAQGLSMYVASAYRSYDDQCRVFNTTMTEWIDQGYTPLDAYAETKKSVAVPGSSEHATGLAVDIIASAYEALDDRQGDTPEQQWLMEHCWEYGFILRYPPEKAEITGIIFEPWHYRYVGKTAAKEIKEQNITLEEYLDQ